MTFTRRKFVRLSISSLLCLAGERLLAQGMSQHTAKATARAAPTGRPFDAHFVDVAFEAGLRAPVIYGGVDAKKYILEANGCGCAFLDYDNDGWMDIFLLSGTRLEGAPPEATNRLYKNNRDGTFTDVTEKAGLRAVGWANGVCVGDYNNDGFEDINRDGHLDLFVSNYVRFSFEHAPVPGESSTCNWKGIPVNCGPRGLPTGRHSLYRNNGDGTFTDVSKEAGIASAGETYGMTVVA